MCNVHPCRYLVMQTEYRKQRKRKPVRQLHKGLVRQQASHVPGQTSPLEYGNQLGQSTVTKQRSLGVVRVKVLHQRFQIAWKERLVRVDHRKHVADFFLRSKRSMNAFGRWEARPDMRTSLRNWSPSTSKESNTTGDTDKQPHSRRQANETPMISTHTWQSQHTFQDFGTIQEAKHQHKSAKCLQGQHLSKRLVSKLGFCPDAHTTSTQVSSVWKPPRKRSET